MHPIEYLTVDVFTDQRYGGNPLAVIPDARGVKPESMQSIAAEFNYSETAFVLPPEDPDHTARVRIFTPTQEVPFAGHPNVGTAFALAHRGHLFGWPVGETMRFEEAAGLVEVEVLREDGEAVGAKIKAPGSLEVLGPVEPADAAACVGLEAHSVSNETPPALASVGLPFALVRLNSLDELTKASPVLFAFKSANARYDTRGLDFAVMCYVPLSDEHLRARMFAPLDNIQEDPATGSAAAALAAYLASLDPRADLERSLLIEQGVEMGRPSRLELNVVKRGGSVEGVTVSGRCVAMFRGEFDLS